MILKKLHINFQFMIFRMHNQNPQTASIILDESLYFAVLKIEVYGPNIIACVSQWPFDYIVVVWRTIIIPKLKKHFNFFDCIIKLFIIRHSAIKKRPSQQNYVLFVLVLI